MQFAQYFLYFILLTLLSAADLFSVEGRLPIELQIEAVNDNEIIIHWQGSPSLTGSFVLERKSIGEKYFHPVSKPTTEQSGVIIDHGLKSGLIYLYRMRRVKGSDWVDCTDPKAVVTSFPPPEALVAFPSRGERGIWIKWRDPNGWSEGFIILRKEGKGNFCQITTTSAERDSFLDRDVTPDQFLFYRVLAFTDWNQSPPSKEVEVHYPKRIQKLSKIQPPPLSSPEASYLNAKILTHSIDDHTVSLTIDQTSGGNERLVLERRAEHSSYFVPIDTLVISQGNYLDNTLKSDVRYFYRIRRPEPLSLQDYSPQVEVITHFSPPRSLKATPETDLSVRLTWQGGEKGLIGYLLERKSNESEGCYSPLARLSSGDRSFLDTLAILGVGYRYRIKGYSLVNESDYCYTNSSVKTAFPSPSKLSAKPLSDSRVLLRWSDDFSFENGFIIERWSNGRFAPIARLPKDSTSFVDYTPSGSATPRYRVTAFTASNTGSYSDEVEVNLRLAPPARVSAKFLDYDHIVLNWEDQCELEKGYQIERRSSLSERFKSRAILHANATQFQDDSLVWGKTCWYRIRTIGERSTSEYVNTRPIKIPDPLRDLCSIPSGSFVMGNDLPSAPEDEKPSHLVSLSGYSLGICKVTNDEYRAFCDYVGREYPPDPEFIGMPNYFLNYPNHPVVMVSWFEAVDYCNWLSRMMELKPAYDSHYRLLPDCQGFHLPTEAQFERAIKEIKFTAKTNPSSLIENQHLGMNLKGSEDGYKYTAPVGTSKYDRHQNGLCDLIGNVKEWCQDWYSRDYYSLKRVFKDPVGPQKGKVKSVRGGGWSDSRATDWSKFRSAFNPRSRYNNVGFRVVCDETTIDEIPRSLRLMQKWQSE